jgi:hypothetical protein
MFLIIGLDELCGGLAGQQLRDRGETVLALAQPLRDTLSFEWMQTNAGSTSFLWSSGAREPTIASEQIQGVLVGRCDELATEPESFAGLFAWLWSLDCPVVNRLSPNLWFRGRWSPLEWQPILQQHHLRAPRGLITSELDVARAFGERWDGAVTYQPISSLRRYPVASASDWDGLNRILAHVPVCVLEPVSGDRFNVCSVGGQCTWSADVAGVLDSSTRERMESGISSLGRALDLSVCELEFGLSAGEPVCLSVSVFPELGAYPEPRQHDVVGQLVSLVSAT